MLKFNDIKPGLKTSKGEIQYISGVEKDKTTAPVWRNRVEYYGWIVTARIDGELVNIKFDTRDTFSGIKYNHETPSQYRMKL